MDQKGLVKKYTLSQKLERVVDCIELLDAEQRTVLRINQELLKDNPNHPGTQGLDDLIVHLACGASVESRKQEVEFWKEVVVPNSEILFPLFANWMDRRTKAWKELMLFLDLGILPGKHFFPSFPLTYLQWIIDSLTSTPAFEYAEPVICRIPYRHNGYTMGHDQAICFVIKRNLEINPGSFHRMWNWDIMHFQPYGHATIPQSHITKLVLTDAMKEEVRKANERRNEKQ
jgi:hypothetical protein